MSCYWLDVNSDLLQPPFPSFIFPIARPKLSATELERDVPRLGNRQFVVDQSGKHESDVLAERRQFWSRHALLKNVKAWWGIVSVLNRSLDSSAHANLVNIAGK